MLRMVVAAVIAVAVAASVTPASAAGCADEMKAVKAAWDKAPAGPKKDAALKEYKMAEQAHAKKDEKACMGALAKAKTAMK